MWCQSQTTFWVKVALEETKFAWVESESDSKEFIMLHLQETYLYLIVYLPDYIPDKLCLSIEVHGVSN